METEHNSKKPTFTILIPSHNRGYVIGETLDSIQRSKYKNIEVLIVDDGSTDNTKKTIEEFKKKSDLSVRYIFQENQGKHVALNTGAKKAYGEFVVNIDSDDLLLPNALNEIYTLWKKVPEKERPSIAGVVANCVKEDGSLSGTETPNAPLRSSFLKIRKEHNLNGEKRWILRSEVMQEFPYPTFPGEKHSRPGLIVNRISKKYDFIFSNIRLLMVRHMPDGITANRKIIQNQNPLGYRQYFLEEIRDNAGYTSRKSLKSYYKRYIKMSLLSGVSLKEQAKEAPNLYLWMQCLPKALVTYLRERTNNIKK